MSTSNPKQQQQKKGSKIKTTGQDILWIQTKKIIKKTLEIQKKDFVPYSRGDYS